MILKFNHSDIVCMLNSLNQSKNVLCTPLANIVYKIRKDFQSLKQAKSSIIHAKQKLSTLLHNQVNGQYECKSSFFTQPEYAMLATSIAHNSMNNDSELRIISKGYCDINTDKKQCKAFKQYYLA